MDAPRGELRWRPGRLQALLEPLLWLLRQGDPYARGVACSALAQFDCIIPPGSAQHASAAERFAYVAAVSAVPGAALLSCPNDYARYSAAR